MMHPPNRPRPYFVTFVHVIGRYATFICARGTSYARTETCHQTHVT